MNINGCNISNCGGITIVNGHIVSGGGILRKPQKFNEKKSLQADGIDRITIRSDSADILVTASNTNAITAHFRGKAITNEKPVLDIAKNGREVIVTLSIGNFVMSDNISLFVTIPTRIFEFLSVTSYNRFIVVKDKVSAKEMALNAFNGSIGCEGNFAKIFAFSHNGDVYLYANAKSDINIEAISYNGNVTVELENIASNNISVSTRNGFSRNRFRGTRYGYIAYGRAESQNGNVTIR